jgi:hypothetical protein
MWRIIHIDMSHSFRYYEVPEQGGHHEVSGFLLLGIFVRQESPPVQ